MFRSLGAAKRQGGGLCLGQPVQWAAAGGDPPRHRASPRVRNPGSAVTEEVLSILQTLMPLSNASPRSALIFKTNTEANQVDLSQLLEAICNAT